MLPPARNSTPSPSIVPLISHGSMFSSARTNFRPFLTSFKVSPLTSLNPACVGIPCPYGSLTGALRDLWLYPVKEVLFSSAISLRSSMWGNRSRSLRKLTAVESGPNPSLTIGRHAAVQLPLSGRWWPAQYLSCHSSAVKSMWIWLPSGARRWNCISPTVSNTNR